MWWWGDTTSDVFIETPSLGQVYCHRRRLECNSGRVLLFLLLIIIILRSGREKNTLQRYFFNSDFAWKMIEKLRFWTMHLVLKPVAFELRVVTHKNTCAFVNFWYCCYRTQCPLRFLLAFVCLYNYKFTWSVVSSLNWPASDFGGDKLFHSSTIWI